MFEEQPFTTTIYITVNVDGTANYQIVNIPETRAMLEFVSGHLSNIAEYMHEYPVQRIH